MLVSIYCLHCISLVCITALASLHVLLQISLSGNNLWGLDGGGGDFIQGTHLQSINNRFWCFLIMDWTGTVKKWSWSLCLVVVVIFFNAHICETSWELASRWSFCSFYFIPFYKRHIYVQNIMKCYCCFVISWILWNSILTIGGGDFTHGAQWKNHESILGSS